MKRVLDEKVLRLSFRGGKTLRYGENPHQKGEFYTQPGGSLRDQLTIDFCNKQKVPMVFCGVRCFRH